MSDDIEALPDVWLPNLPLFSYTTTPHIPVAPSDGFVGLPQKGSIKRKDFYHHFIFQPFFSALVCTILVGSYDRNIREMIRLGPEWIVILYYTVHYSSTLHLKAHVPAPRNPIFQSLKRASRKWMGDITHIPSCCFCFFLESVKVCWRCYHA